MLMLKPHCWCLCGFPRPPPIRRRWEGGSHFVFRPQMFAGSPVIASRGALGAAMCRTLSHLFAPPPPRPHLTILADALRRAVGWLEGTLEDLGWADDAGAACVLDPVLADELNQFLQIHYDSDLEMQQGAARMYRLIQAYAENLAELGVPAVCPRAFARGWILLGSPLGSACRRLWCPPSRRGATFIFVSIFCYGLGYRDCFVSRVPFTCFLSLFDFGWCGSSGWCLGSCPARPIPDPGRPMPSKEAISSSA
jgi:hypothetical protein